MIDIGHPPASTADPVEVIEMAAATLVRNFELLSRRSDVYTELDRAEYLLLRTLDQTGPADICTLAAALGLNPSTAGRQVAAMESKGLVERSPAVTDRRRSIISPTGEGRDRMVTTRNRRHENIGKLVSGWSQEDQRTLGEMFTRYNEAIARSYLNPQGDQA